MNKLIRIQTLILAFALIFSLGLTSGQEVSSAPKVKVSKKKVTIKVGQKDTIKIKNVKKKVKWSVKKKNIVKITKIKGKKNNTIKIKGLKKGSTKIIAKTGKKKFTIKVKVKKNGKLVIDNNKPEVVPLPGIVDDTNNEEETTTTEEETTTYYTGLEDIIEVVGDVINKNDITVDDMVMIKYETLFEEDIIYNALPEKLEIYEDGDWIQMEYKEDFTSTYKEAEILGGDEVPLAFTPSKYYQNVRPGHYRYTHQVGVEEVQVEFDITEGESVQEEGSQVIFGEEPAVIVLEAPVTSLALGQDLVINTIIAGKSSWDFTDISEQPGKLEIYEDEVWTPMEYNDENIDWADIDNMIIGSCFRREIVDLDKYYLNVGFGHYRYTYEIGGYEYVFEFDIIEPTITVEVVNSPVALGDDLRIVLSSSGIAGNGEIYSPSFLANKLEIYEDGEWKEMIRLEGTTIEPAITFKNSSYEFTLCLSSKEGSVWAVYEDLRAGHYRYSHMINGEYYSDEFDIVEP